MALNFESITATSSSQESLLLTNDSKFSAIYHHVALILNLQSLILWISNILPF
jgi:hypothetical protein